MPFLLLWHPRSTGTTPPTPTPFTPTAAVPMGGGVLDSPWKTQADKRRKEAMLEEQELLMLGRAAIERIVNDLNS